MDMDFAREILPVVAVMIIFCMGDITLVQMLPWKRSIFYTESKGFPSMSLMVLCVERQNNSINSQCYLPNIIFSSKQHSR